MESGQKKLQGTEVQVYREGRLCVKSSIFSNRRQCSVELKGHTLTVSRADQGKAKLYDLKDATLLKQDNQKKLVVQLANKEKLSLYTANQQEFEEWTETLADCIEWKIQRFYEIGPEVGRGAFATVRKGKHKRTRDVVAVKIINKGVCGEENLMYLQREIDITRSLHHRNIVRTDTVFESKERVYIVLEYMQGGTLDRFILRNGVFSEDDARDVMWDILVGVAHLHHEGIVHRDIKPENIMCSGKRVPMTAKLMDFGLSRRANLDDSSQSKFDCDGGLGPGGLMTTPVGTPGYAAPEILENRPYGKEVDLFACGVVMYMSLCGYTPFHHAEANQLAGLVKRADFKFPEQEWQGISNMCKDLITRMLDRSPYARISAEDALEHPWMKTNFAARTKRKRTVKAREENDLNYVDPEVVSVNHANRLDSSFEQSSLDES